VNRSIAPILLAATACAIAAPATAKTDAVVQQAIQLHGAGKAQQAYELLYPQVPARAGDPDFDYALGLAAADSGHYGEALAAFQRVVAVQPTNSQARAEIARVYAMAGDIDTAKAQFDTVLADPSVPDPVRQRINRLSRQYGETIEGGPRRVSGFLDLEGGYDTNVNAATSATSITFPVLAFLGPATLGGNASSLDKPFAQVAGGLSLDAPLSRQTKLFVSGQGFWRETVDSKPFDQAAVGATAGIAHSLVGGDVVSLAAQGQNFWLGGDSYRSSVGAVAQYTHRLSQGAALSVAANYARLNYDGDPARDANRYAGSASFAGKTVYAAINGGVEDLRRNIAPNLGFAFVGGQVGFEQPVMERVALTGSAGIEYRDHRGTDPLFLAGRHDTQANVSFGVRIAIDEGFSFRPRATYTRNWSNLPLYDYERATFSLALRKEF
jgi:hypothetical protein